jgi:dihydropteroate synthase
MSGLPAHAVRVLHPHDSQGLVRELVNLGVDVSTAAGAVRRASGRVVRFDALSPAVARVIESTFFAIGGVAHSGPSAYRGKHQPSAEDVVAIGTAGQFELLASRLSGPTDLGDVADAISRALAVATWGAGTLHLGRFRLDLAKRVAVMGILNVTPDSFHDGGRYFDPERAVERGLAMVDEGADLIDVGGDSASGEAAEIDADEEIRRIEPVVRALASKVPVPIAIDTHRAKTATAALDAGATLVNDITGLSDPQMARVVAQTDAAVCVMHIKGVPKKFPPDWHYRNVIGDLLRFLEARTSIALQAGIAPERICVDPGIEFGKLIGHDLEIFRRIDELHTLGFPILLAASRKTIVGNILGGLPSSERLEGTAAVNTYAIARGARIIRVHDVRAMARVARMSEALIGMSIDGTPMERCRADGTIVEQAELLPAFD